MRIEDEEAIDAAVRGALADGAAPGCVVALGSRAGVLFLRAYGRRALEPEPEPMTVDTVFDLASLTKAVATATAAMILVERGALSLDEPAARHLPALREGPGHARGRITARQLLTHTAGLPPVNPLRDYRGPRAARVRRAAQVALAHPPGVRVRYSDLSFLLLGEIVAAAAGAPLDAFVERALFRPLGMSSTGFGPRAPARVAPTERAPRRGGAVIRGEVHDPRAWRLGGVAGHAGLFSSAPDLARFARMLLGGGALDGARVLDEATVAEMTRARALPGGTRALGWDARRRGMSARAFGHGGFTGTSLWIDPARDVFLLLLSNRVHPDGGGDVGPLLRRLAPLAVRARRRAEPVRPAPVRVGLDVLEARGFAPLVGARVALLTHRAARARDGRRALDVLHAAPEVTVVRALAPEHGLGGDAEGRVRDGVDAASGVPVRGLFGPTRAPTDAMLEGVDTIVVDLQDVGVRFYTYASTVRRVLEAAAARGLRVVLLDRPDPLGGGPPRGPVSEPALASFVNHHPLPTVHGLTLGELASLLNAERGIGADLVVVPLEGWSREGPRGWATTGLRWVPPSPNLRSPDAARLYPGLALLEGTNVSVGRGTDAPFTVLGAPYVDGAALAEALGPVEGVTVRPTRFTPRASRHRGRPCGGVAFTLHEPARLEPVRLGLALAGALRALYPQRWDPSGLERMLGHRGLSRALLAGAPPDALARRWGPDLARFAARRAAYLRY